MVFYIFGNIEIQEEEHGSTWRSTYKTKISIRRVEA